MRCRNPTDPTRFINVDVNAFEFVVLSALRAQQLLAGCTPRLPGTHRATTMAQMEVADGCIGRLRSETATAAPQSPETLLGGTTG